ncbi:unnamed protein product [Cochlearia groenlandica]
MHISNVVSQYSSRIIYEGHQCYNMISVISSYQEKITREVSRAGLSGVVQRSDDRWNGHRNHFFLCLLWRSCWAVWRLLSWTHQQDSLAASSAACSGGLVTAEINFREPSVFLFSMSPPAVWTGGLVTADCFTSTPFDSLSFS